LDKFTLWKVHDINDFIYTLAKDFSKKKDLYITYFQMDRNSIIGIILITLILITFGLWNRPSDKDLQIEKRRADSIAFFQKQQAAFDASKQAQKKDTSLAVTGKLDSAGLAKEKDALGVFGGAILGKNEFTTIENKLIKIVVSNKGGRIYSVLLKKYNRYDSLPVKLFDGDSTVFSLDFFSQNRTISTGSLYFTPSTQEKDIKADKEAKSLSMRLDAGDGRYIEYKYTLKPDDYMIDFNIIMSGLDQIIAKNVNTLDLKWEYYVPRQEKGFKNENQYTSIYYKFFQDEVDFLSPTSTKDEEKDLTNKVQWVAYKQQFFSSALISDKYFEKAVVKSVKFADQGQYLKKFSSVIGIPFDNDSKTSNISLKFYFGPNKYSILKQYKIDLEELVFLGRWIIKWINRFVIIPVFNVLNGFIGNYGIIILLLTIIIKVCLFPLTYKSYMSTAKMKVLKPQIDEINAKIPKEKAMERQKATMALYKKVGVNPMSGCLPMLLQMPILIAMFRFFPTSIELRQQGFLWAKDLSTYDSIYSWSAQIPLISSFYGNHISLFVILMTITTLITIKMNDQSASANQQMPGMKTMMYIMPVMFMFIFNNFSAGLSYYYFLANLVTIGQNYIFKSIVNEEDVLKRLHDNKKKPAKKSKFQEKLELMAKQKGYQLPKR
jgi:YidC/Oxa1 family membrane protein insertase